MALDKNGVLLEGIRSANANNPFTFPPRNLVTNDDVFNSVTNRSEYVVVASSSDNSIKSTDIGDPSLIFGWTKNEGNISRFTYDGYTQKWLPSPGSLPDNLGVISNSPRLISPIPDLTILDAPFNLYIGETSRIFTFTVQIVGTESDFDSSVQGTVQLAKDSGLLNFSSTDLVTFDNKPVFCQRQSFFNRTQFKGILGSVPLNSSIEYFINFNPLPDPSQIPLLRLDYQRYLVSVQVANESLLINVSSGTFKWASDTGRIKLSDDDINLNTGKSVYYDGIYNGTFQLSRTDLGSLNSGWPSASFSNSELVGLTDISQYFIFAESGNMRNYFPAKFFTNSHIPNKSPVANECFINTDTGSVFMNPADISKFSGWEFKFVDSTIEVDNGVSIKFSRSAVNSSGTSIEPDFTILYHVNDQIIMDGVGQFPFIMLPTIPVVDSDLEYSIQRGPSSTGTFVGTLKNSIDPDQSGLGYTTNLDQKQLIFANRKIVNKTVSVPVPTIKLDDGVINPLGFEVKKNGAPILPGIDFEFDSSTGELKFLKSIGINDPSNKLNISGQIILPNTFTSSDIGFFGISDIGGYFFIQNGSNTGIYKIISVFNDIITVDSPFLSSGSTTGDVINNAEVIADNFWTSLSQSLRQISVFKGNNTQGPFDPINDFTILPTISQINLNSPARTGDVYQISYIYNDNGISRNVSEFASFKIRLETAIVTSGSSTVHFNTADRQVDVSRPIEIFVNGITQKSDSFQFISPNDLILQAPVESGQIVTITYWVNDAVGGETSFQLTNNNLVVDTLKININQTSLALNGNYLTSIFPQSVLLAIKAGEVIIINSVSYDSVTDKTVLNFNPAVFDSGNNESFQVSTALIEIIPEASIVNMCLKGMSNISFTGNTDGYSDGTIVILDSESYRAVASKYDVVNNQTVVSLAVPLKRNYVSPSISHSGLPILFPTNQFSTDFPVDTSSDFKLIQMGSDQHILIRDVDYKVSEGSINTINVIGGTSSLFALYVAQKNQEIGDIFNINYSYAIAPNSGNGIVGQRLLSSYNLYSPDSFFFRIETVETFLPEVQDLLRQSSQSTGVSGPNTRDVKGRSNKDEGSPSPYFDEQHLSNLDFSIIQLLKFYNDLSNLYEDLLSNVDGRIVGGEHGRFRFDGNLDNPARNSYSEVTNDLDDKVVLYFKKVLTGFFTFEDEPVFVSMSDTNPISRIYSSQSRVDLAINNLVGPSNHGQVLGTVGIESISNPGNFISTQASFFTDNIVSSDGNINVFFNSNGDFDNLVPPFVSGTKASIFTNEGVLVVTGVISFVGSNLFSMSGSTNLVNGSVARNVSDPEDTTVSRYKTGFDIGLNSSTGEVVNITNSFTLPGNPQINIAGNEILNVELQYNNQETTPRRIPVLDGSINNDYGFLSAPRLRRSGETVLYTKETFHLSNINFFSIIDPNLDIINLPVSVFLGDNIIILNGPNEGEIRQVTSVLVPNAQYKVNIPFPFADSGSSAERILPDGSHIEDTLSQEINILSDNMSGIPIGSITSIDSELFTVGSIIDKIGISSISGTGNVISNSVFEDNSVDFSLLNINSKSYLYLIDGANRGLYSITDVTTHHLTIGLDPDFSNFPFSTGFSSYNVINLESFISESEPRFLSKFMRETISFLNSTETWRDNVSASGKSARHTSIASRLLSIDSYIDSINTILTQTDQLYDIRYLWIQQRTDKKTGLLIQQKQAIKKRQEDLVKIVGDQKKLLITQNL